MPNWELVDDTSSYITYSGSWTRISGSTRQWNGAVYSTSQAGATATFRFRGTALKVTGTVPAGSGTVHSRYTIDGGNPILVDRRCGSGDAYSELFLERSGLSAVDHTLVITNVGSEADFRLDKIEWLPVSNDPDSERPLPPAPPPPPPPPPPTSTPTQTRNPPTSVVTQTVTSVSSVGGGSSDATTGTETKTETQSSVQTVIISTFTSNGTPVTSTTTSTASSSFPLSTAVVTTTDASGREVAGTMIVMVSDGHTTTVEAAPGSAGAGRTGAASGLSKGALAGIIVGVLVLLFVFLFLLFWLLRRIRRRRRLLEEGEVVNNSANAPAMMQARGGRIPQFTAFDFTAPNTSSQDLLPSSGLSRGGHALQRPSSVHKPPIDDGTDDAESDMYLPYSPATSHSHSANATSYFTSALSHAPQGLSRTLFTPQASHLFGYGSHDRYDIRCPSFLPSHPWKICQRTWSYYSRVEVSIHRRLLRGAGSLRTVAHLS
ncbi:hypothetical protein NMY22_g4091 [Coprinellus aureogranulatus]|nr:hypothetical protein NMY22_g4091 [Coprinellus aureogranulatus]